MTLGANILIADDDPQIREVLGIAFSRAGFSTTTASHGLFKTKWNKSQLPI